MDKVLLWVIKEKRLGSELDTSEHVGFGHNSQLNRDSEEESEDDKEGQEASHDGIK